ncbi:MAG: hypothetical protein N2314_05105 [Brevinematales bacterium]|nr:hypothetical protein [Brevinematales bacterium]
MKAKQTPLKVTKDHTVFLFIFPPFFLFDKGEEVYQITRKKSRKLVKRLTFSVKKAKKEMKKYGYFLKEKSRRTLARGWRDREGKTKNREKREVFEWKNEATGRISLTKVKKVAILFKIVRFVCR